MIGIAGSERIGRESANQSAAAAARARRRGTRQSRSSNHGLSDSQADRTQRNDYDFTIAEHQASVDIDKPVAEVWAFVADLAKTPQWRTTVTSVTPPAHLAAGSEFDASTHVLGRNWSWRLRITKVVPEEEFGYEVIEGIVDMQVDYRLEASDGGCLFTLAGRSRPGNLITRLIDRAGAWQLKREINGHVVNLKRILENSDV